MDVYDGLLNAIQTEYDLVRQLKKSERGSVRVVRHRQSGVRFVFRRYEGSGAVYQKLLPVSCPNLPQIMETAERNAQVIVLEEFVHGDTLAFLLEGGTSPRHRPDASPGRSAARCTCCTHSARCTGM